MLDYEAGKCRISNYLSNEINISVFDIDVEMIRECYNENVTIIKNIEKDKTNL